MTQVELVKAMQALKALEQESEAIEKRKEALKDAIKAEMVSRGVDELEAGTFRATWKEVSSKRFDTTAFKKDDPETYNKYCKEQKTRRFLLK